MIARPFARSREDLTGYESGMRSSRGVAALCAVQLVDVLGVTVVITALPAMLARSRRPPSASGLVVTGYAMFFGGLLVLGARCGDRFGHRRVLQAGLAVFGLASLSPRSLPGLPLLVVARCLQGLAAALSVPAALRLLVAVAREGERGDGHSRCGAPAVRRPAPRGSSWVAF